MIPLFSFFCQAANFFIFLCTLQLSYMVCNHIKHSMSWSNSHISKNKTHIHNKIPKQHKYICPYNSHIPNLIHTKHFYHSKSSNNFELKSKFLLKGFVFIWASCQCSYLQSRYRHNLRPSPSNPSHAS
jgi:hypothetical protein